MNDTKILFVKLIFGPKTDWLQEEYPNAFLLLCHIARHCRHTNSIPDGLEIGDCIIGEIGTPKKCGLTLRQFRTAREKLIEFNLIEIVFNPKSKNPQKRSIKRLIKSLVVNVCNSEIFDVTFTNNVDQNVDQSLINGGSGVDKQRRKEIDKKEKKEQPTQGAVVDFLSFREFVKLTQNQYDTLIAKHGISLTDKMLDILDSYKGSTGKKYDSDYHTMKEGGWVYQRATEKTKILQMPGAVDRRTRNQDGTPVTSPADGRF